MCCADRPIGKRCTRAQPAMHRPCADKVAFAKSVGGQGFSILELAIVLAEFG